MLGVNRSEVTTAQGSKVLKYNEQLRETIFSLLHIRYDTLGIE